MFFNRRIPVLWHLQVLVTFGVHLVLCLNLLTTTRSTDIRSIISSSFSVAVSLSCILNKNDKDKQRNLLRDFSAISFTYMQHISDLLQVS